MLGVAGRALVLVGGHVILAAVFVVVNALALSLREC